MTAGLDTVGRIWRFTTPTDDDVGGAVPTGMLMYSPVYSHITSEKPTLALLEQGLETPEIFSAIMSYTQFSPTGSFNVQHNDIYEVTYPPISHYYQKKFRIVGVQYPPINDSRRFLICTLRRMETANSNDLQ